MTKLILITLFFQGAYLPNYNLYYGINENEYEKLELDSAYYIEFGIDLYFYNLFFINGSINNLFHARKDELEFYPDCDKYQIAAGIRYKFIEIGYEHLCFHPIFPLSSNGRKLINNTILEGGYDKYYINFELTGKI